ncbi:hypothetical protein OVY01_04205 [Robbsia sp. Bb-Pol-6]|uniref:Uncharacterized protein n=1 Tax=Robbsia betulipollinis TaxID=2981849 RepID=A0ABT3ZIU2_9BURK|nr:hypothetical protein [Robbsia betulipollinis]MCY0386456.1 hypothetical protein [Robbsia betulipollinis]
MSAAVLAGWAPWLLPALAIAALALCVMRARRRQRRRRQRELVGAARSGVVSPAMPAAASSGVVPPVVAPSPVVVPAAIAPVGVSSKAVPSAAALPVVPPPTVTTSVASSAHAARSAAAPSVASLLTAATPTAVPSTVSVPPAPAASPAPSIPTAGPMVRSGSAGQVPGPAPVHRSGDEAGRREMAALEALRGLEFGDREQAALQAQLARAPRDVGALFGLLQWHARRGERAQVESFAHALWDETDAEGELWRRAAVLGRVVDPDNPLYSADPFAALAEHAARQPARAPLALDAFDLSLPEENEPAIPTSSMPVARPVDVDRASHVAEAPPAGFDIFNAPTARLPASFAGLDLNLDEPSAPAVAVDRPRRTAGRRRGRAKGAQSSDV